MKQVKYILVNETDRKNHHRVSDNPYVRDLRHYHIVDGDLTSSLSRAELVRVLVELRRHFPDAKILGVSEIGDHCIIVSDAMNALRRELSDLP